MYIMDDTTQYSDIFYKPDEATETEVSRMVLDSQLEDTIGSISIDSKLFGGAETSESTYTRTTDTAHLEKKLLDLHKLLLDSDVNYMLGGGLPEVTDDYSSSAQRSSEPNSISITKSTRVPINYSESTSISSYRPTIDYMSSPTLSGAIGDPYGNTPSVATSEYDEYLDVDKYQKEAEDSTPSEKLDKSEASNSSSVTNSMSEDSAKKNKKYKLIKRPPAKKNKSKSKSKSKSKKKKKNTPKKKGKK